MRNRLIYVVGSEQSQHLQMVFAVARQAGWLTDAVSAEHAAIGLVTGPDGKRLRTRTGEQVKLIDADRRGGRARRARSSRTATTTRCSGEQIAEAVGIGALKYGDLSVARDSSYVFDFDRMLALTGNTGPYLQYATARIRSIFRRAGLDPAASTGPIQLDRGRRAGARAAPARASAPAVGQAAQSRRAAPAGRLPVRRRQRLHHVLRAVPGTAGRQPPGRRQQARAVRADAAGPDDRARPARHPGARTHVAAGRAGAGPGAAR